MRVYENKGGNWIQLGGDINGETAGDRSGSSVALSAVGTILAIGAPINDGNDGNGSYSGHVRVYENQGGNWIQLGGDINGETAGDTSGSSVALSSDGTILAIGAPNFHGSNAGQVRVYENQGGNWMQLGGDINGGAGDKLGSSVALSADGTILAIGAPSSNGNGSNSGHVRVYENQGGDWIQQGGDINGETTDDFSGSSVALSADGTILAIGAPNNDGGGTNAGHTRIYNLQGGNWIQVGQDIDGVDSDGEFSSGSSISLSADGIFIAVGSFTQNDASNFANRVRIYRNINNTWIQRGEPIDGQFLPDFNSYSVSLSSDNNTVALGNTFNNENGFSSGQVQVYDISSVLSLEDNIESWFSIYVIDNYLKVESVRGTDISLEKITLYNNLGQSILTSTSAIINTSFLSRGVYIIEVFSSQGRRFTQKLILRS